MHEPTFTEKAKLVLPSLERQKAWVVESQFQNITSPGHGFKAAGAARSGRRNVTCVFRIVMLSPTYVLILKGRSQSVLAVHVRAEMGTNGRHRFHVRCIETESNGTRGKSNSLQIRYSLLTINIY